jgi:glycosyltransferase involved in cell wall biosynthesis
MKDKFYIDFENHFRGSQEVILKRLQFYIQFTKHLNYIERKPKAIDLACGRGEWLELIKNNGFTAKGCDLDAEMVELCRQKKLEVKECDIIEFLGEQQNNSVDIISAFHIIEHINFELIRKLIQESQRILVPGGILIIETPNPENLIVASCNFYLDPTHKRPIPPELLNFTVKYEGFKKIKIVRLQEPIDKDDIEEEEIKLSDIFNGVSPDYGLIAFKEGGEKNIYISDKIYGNTLKELINIYDKKIKIKPKEYINNNIIKKIGIDITPILPGGDNGGAKIFTLELIKQLGIMNPDVKFILFTQESAHYELKYMETHNVTRVLMIKNDIKKRLNLFKNKYITRILEITPNKVKEKILRIIIKIISKFKRISANKTMAELKIDLLFCPFTAPTYYKEDIPLICTIYDLQHKSYPSFFSNEEIANRNNYFTEAFNKATLLTVISDYSREKAIEFGKINPKKIRRIYLHTRNNESSKPNHNELFFYKKIGLEKKRYLIYPANFWHHKNHEILITAFGMACHNGLPKDIKLVLTGEPGKRQQELSCGVRAFNLQERILFPGFVANNELVNLMENSIGLVFPSLYEGFGLPVVEAMGAGVPVICSNVTALPEIVADAAILFNPKIPEEISESMLLLVKNSMLRDNMIIEGLKRAKKFKSLEEVAQNYWSIFIEATILFQKNNI